ncbi:DUF72 domain-containing protein [Povalibacter sp.]|uniref:DUF72 domain-containing protein n=1 Tax=Povalibacter sp. TaxID=1962978 RepID=UPI002F418FB8
MAKIRIGISGWRYAPWRGVFYPPDLPQRQELWFVSQRFNTVEINGSFYSLQRPEYFADWYAQTPADFVFAVKGPRFITHMKRLRSIATPLANFFASGVFNLREKLGPILWQLPPNLAYDGELIAQFFELLPPDTPAALQLARRRDFRLKGRARLAIDASRPLRHAIEVRHESFRCAGFIAQLREYGIALVVAETAGKWPMLEDVTADFMYLRLHGDKKLYASGYGDRALERWAQRIRHWHRGTEPPDARKVTESTHITTNRDVFCYFDNTDVKLRAPVDAQALAVKLAQGKKGPQSKTVTRSRRPRSGKVNRVAPPSSSRSV